MMKTFPKSIPIRLFSLILFALINTVGFPSFSDHLKTQNYHTANTKLLQKVKSNLTKKYKNDPRKKIFYIGAGLWGNERWSTNDAVKIGNALEKFYPNRTVIKIILSNDEKKKLPDIYPSTLYLPTVAKEVERFYKKDDLIVIGLYSHGRKGMLVARPGGKGHKGSAVKADNIKKYILKRLGVDKSKVVLILSACYSGSLVKPLQHRNVVIATSADSDKVSFGCGNNSTNTFYASALISELTRRKSSKTYSIVNALEEARRTVQSMEAQKGYPRSNPQLVVGKNFNDRVPKEVSLKNYQIFFNKMELKDRKEIQQRLEAFGYDSSIDGLWGGGTMGALSRFIERKNIFGKKLNPKQVFDQILNTTQVPMSEELRGLIASPNYKVANNIKPKVSDYYSRTFFLSATRTDGDAFQIKVSFNKSSGKFEIFSGKRGAKSQTFKLDNEIKIYKPKNFSAYSDISLNLENLMVQLKVNGRIYRGILIESKYGCWYGNSEGNKLDVFRCLETTKNAEYLQDLGMKNVNTKYYLSTRDSNTAWLYELKPLLQDLLQKNKVKANQ